MKNLILLFALLSSILRATASQYMGVNLPESRSNLVLKAPINTWDEAIPLGNGLLGGLLWGDNNVVRLSLDRGDLWDERTNGEKKWWKKYTYEKGVELINNKNFELLNRWWDTPYNGVTPTKLPAGRIEIIFPKAEKLDVFELKLATAEGQAKFKSGATINVMYDANNSVALISVKGATPDSISLLSTMDVYRRNTKADGGPSSGGSMDKLGYDDAQIGSTINSNHYVQEAAEGLSYCVYVASKQCADETLYALTVCSTNDAPDFISLAQKRCEKALKIGYDKTQIAHVKWWENFWLKSSVIIPDTTIQKQYNLQQYFYGAASRNNAPPMPLQGVWTADNGSLPPWKGDYHNDLNTQMTYMAYQQAGRFDEGLSYINYLWDRRDVFNGFAKDFYGTEGLACPGVMSLAGQPLGGWGQYSMSPTMSAWSAHLFYLHWMYSADYKFLKQKAYPWCAGVGECMLGILKPDKAGILKLPLSTSPEIFDNSPNAWLEPNTNYDLMCLKMLFLSLKEMAIEMKKTDEAKKWGDAAIALGDFHTKLDGTLLIDASIELSESHRHLSNLMGLYPFNLITNEGGSIDQKRIKASLKNWKDVGTGLWVGYSFSWMSCLQARVGDAEEAIRNLEIFTKAFVLRNGFHVNGDQTKSGYSNFTYRPFTLEGNFLASQAVQEMLLQSWSATPGKPNTGIIRLFPATPDKWADASFVDLRAEGGHKVSARRENGKTVWFRIKAGKTGVIRIKDNFDQQIPERNFKGLTKQNDIYIVKLRKGQVFELQFE